MQAAEQLRLGLFNLLKPERITVTTDAQSISLTGDDGQARTLAAGQKLTINASGDALLCRVDSELAWRTVKLQVAAEGAFIVMDITGKLTRRVPAQVEFRRQGRTIQPLLTLPLEAAVAAITASELSDTGINTTEQAREVFKALTVVVRSYLRGERTRHYGEGYDFCDNTHCLLYYGEDIFTRIKASQLIREAGEDTAGRVLRYEQEVVPGYFTASCGGLTAQPDMVWTGRRDGRYRFRSVKCSYCTRGRFYRWQRAISQRTLWRALRAAAGFPLDEGAQLRVVKRAPGGFVTALELENHGQRLELSGARFRHLVGERLGWNIVLSNAYEIQVRGRQLVFTGRGFGHNLGLCMTGAIEQARRGRGYQAILFYYFPGASIEQLVHLN